jgi:hypothetical protein
VTKGVHLKTKEVVYTGDWNNLYSVFTSNNRIEIVKEIERLLVQIPIFKG